MPALLATIGRSLPALFLVCVWAYAYVNFALALSSHTIEAIVLMAWCGLGAVLYLGALKFLRVAEVS